MWRVRAQRYACKQIGSRIRSCFWYDAFNLTINFFPIHTRMDPNHTERLSQPLLDATQGSGAVLGPRSSICLLLVTIALESIGTLCLKRAFDGPHFAVLAYTCYFSSLGLFSLVLRHLPLSIAYTTWCTLGTVSVCILSSVVYGEQIGTRRWVCIVCTMPFTIALYVDT